MDDDLRFQLFDPADSRALAVAHRPADCSAVTAVVSDVVWLEVVKLLRWTAASTGDSPGLDAGRWWRLAAGCAHLLRRLPGLCDELGEGWDRPVPLEDDGATGTARVQRAAARLLDLLRSGRPVPLPTLAGEIDALGAAALGALAASSSWVLPTAPS
jgi:hypothetical protein